MTFQAYQTREGDRWDIIAHIYYRDPYGYERIIDANPSYRDLLLLPGGVELKIPVLASTEVNTIPDSDLPPWKRASINATATA